MGAARYSSAQHAAVGYGYVLGIFGKYCMGAIWR